MVGVGADEIDVQFRALLDYVRELGASDDEIAGAAANLGPLALDLAMRPPGKSTPYTEYAASGAVDVELLSELWRALGLPLAPEMPFPVTPDLAQALEFMAAMLSVLSRDVVVGFARVVGMTTARLADALSSASRVGVEIPTLESGTSYIDVTKSVAAVVRDLLPPLWDAIGAVLRRQIVLVSYKQWTTDVDRVAVTLDRSIGFVDLVGSTELVTSLPVARLARLIDDFEQLVWDTVTAAGGRVVKLIGDEAMFVMDDGTSACQAAFDVVRRTPQPVRVGLATGPVVALRGDYYGPVVNLAARLAAAAPESVILVSEELRRAASPSFGFEPFATGPLRGFAPDVAAFRLTSD